MSLDRIRRPPGKTVVLRVGPESLITVSSCAGRFPFYWPVIEVYLPSEEICVPRTVVGTSKVTCHSGSDMRTALEPSTSHNSLGLTRAHKLHDTVSISSGAINYWLPVRKKHFLDYSCSIFVSKLMFMPQIATPDNGRSGPERIPEQLFRRYWKTSRTAGPR
jgi:hypothetical protein